LLDLSLYSSLVESLAPRWGASTLGIYSLNFIAQGESPTE
jgi:hypothetical protein